MEFKDKLAEHGVTRTIAMYGSARFSEEYDPHGFFKKVNVLFYQIGKTFKRTHGVVTGRWARFDGSRQ